MDGIVQTLHMPAFILLEVITLAIVIYLFRDLRETRKALYDKIEEAEDNFDTKIGKVHGALIEHEKAQAKERADDQRWRGEVDQKLKTLEEKM